MQFGKQPIQFYNLLVLDKVSIIYSVKPQINYSTNYN